MQGKANVRCVVADDHEALRLGLARSLEASGEIEVVGEADNGSAALAIIERRGPDVAVIAHSLAGMGGIDITSDLTARGSKVGVVLYTAEDDPAVVQAALAAGVLGYVLKRSPVSEVTRAVRLVARGETYVDPTVVGALLEHRTQKLKPLLSQREVEVLQLLSDGRTTSSAASELFLSPATVRSYIESAMHKLGSRSRTHAVASALRNRIIS